MRVSKVKWATWETFPEYLARRNSSDPYDDDFVVRSRNKVMEYDMETGIMRRKLLDDISGAVPSRLRGEIFYGVKLEGK
ncbi:MAG: hypothetical protein M0P69_18835 [Bacteroidales bacterium]|nr:hypothetical protein [Bacteroidales bacterium]